MKAFNLYKVRGYTRKWVALPVSALRIRKGLNATKPGVYLFSGCWYKGNPRTIEPYGKIIPACDPDIRPRPVGKIGTRFAVSGSTWHKRLEAARPKRSFLANIRDYFNDEEDTK